MENGEWKVESGKGRTVIAEDATYSSGSHAPRGNPNVCTESFPVVILSPSTQAFHHAEHVEG